jgi:hypothetical protein
MLNLQMVYSELKEMGVSTYATLSEVVTALWAFNSFLQNESNPPDPDQSSTESYSLLVILMDRQSCLQPRSILQSSIANHSQMHSENK